MQCNTYVVFQTFEQVEKHSKPAEKLNFLEHIKDCYIFKEIVNIVYNTNIKTYLSFNTLSNLVRCGQLKQPNTATFDQFLELVKKLNSKELVGKEKINSVKSFLEKCDQLHCKWYKRILSKDLRIGAGVELIKKLYKDENVIHFRIKPMLAYDSHKVTNIDELLESHDWYFETKIDGVRLLTVFTNDGIECYSRNGKRLTNAEKILLNGFKDDKHMSFVLDKLKNTVLDGEFYSKNISNTMTALFTQNIDIPYTSDMIYYVFDIIPLKSMTSGIYSKNYIDRKQILKKVFNSLKLQKPFVYMKEYKLLKYRKPNESLFNTAIRLADEAIKNGFEGIVLKRKDSIYKCTRTKDWIKVKKFMSEDVLCVDIIRSIKNKDEIAAVKFEYNGKICKCGSGFTKEERKLFAKHPELIVGKIIEVKYQEIGSNGCLRFPVFVRVRPDKS